MKKVGKYIKLLDLQEAYREGVELSEKIREKAMADSANDWAREKAIADSKNLEPAHIPTKLARKKKFDAMSHKKHRNSGHAPSGAHNPRIKEAMKREAEAAVKRSKGIRNPKNSIRELFKNGS